MTTVQHFTPAMIGRNVTVTDGCTAVTGILRWFLTGVTGAAALTLPDGGEHTVDVPHHATVTVETVRQAGLRRDVTARRHADQRAALAAAHTA
jgi:hypothetical protein